jgi:hypothetical protein
MISTAARRSLLSNSFLAAADVGIPKYVPNDDAIGRRLPPAPHLAVPYSATRASQLAFVSHKVCGISISLTATV